MKLRYSKAEKVTGQKKPVRSNPKAFGKAAAAVVLGTALLAGCAAGKTDVKSSKDIGLQKEAPVVIEDIEEEKAYGEINKKLEKPKLLQENSESLKVEPEEPILFGSENCPEFNVGITSYNFIMSNVLSGNSPVYNDSFKGEEPKLKLNEELSNCIKQARYKCGLTVKKDILLSHIEMNNEHNDYMELKVGKVDDKGIYLSLEMQLFGEMTQSGAEYYRINFDGGVTAILKNGKEVSNEEIDHVASKILSLVGFNAEAKPSEKEGEATLVLHLKPTELTQKKKITKPESKYVVYLPSDSNVLTLKKGDEVLTIESADEKSGFVKLSVKKIDSKGITLEMHSEIFMSEPASSEWKINYDGSMSISKGADKFMKEILGIVEFQAKPSKKKGEATLILDTGMGYSEMKMGIIKKKKASVALVAVGPTKAVKKKSYEPELLKAHALIDCTFEKGKSVEKAYEGDSLIDTGGPFYAAGVHAIAIEKVGKEEVELDVHMKENPKEPIRVKLKYGEKKEIGDEQKLTVMVKKTKKEGQVKFIIKQPKGYKKEKPKMLELEVAKHLKAKPIKMKKLKKLPVQYGEEEPKEVTPLLVPLESKEPEGKN